MSRVSAGPSEAPDPESGIDRGRLELSIYDNLFLLTQEDHYRALFVTEGIRPLRLERASDGDTVILASRLLEPEYPQEVRTLREQLRTVVAKEQNARSAFDRGRNRLTRKIAPRRSASSIAMVG